MSITNTNGNALDVTDIEDRSIAIKEDSENQTNITSLYPKGQRELYSTIPTSGHFISTAVQMQGIFAMI